MDVERGGVKRTVICPENKKKYNIYTNISVQSYSLGPTQKISLHTLMNKMHILEYMIVLTQESVSRASSDSRTRHESRMTVAAGRRAYYLISISVDL